MLVEEQLYTEEMKLQQLEDKLINCIQNFLRFSDEIRQTYRQKIELLNSKPLFGSTITA